VPLAQALPEALLETLGEGVWLCVREGEGEGESVGELEAQVLAAELCEGECVVESVGVAAALCVVEREGLALRLEDTVTLGVGGGSGVAEEDVLALPPVGEGVPSWPLGVTLPEAHRLAVVEREGLPEALLQPLAPLEALAQLVTLMEGVGARLPVGLPLVRPLPLPQTVAEALREKLLVGQAERLVAALRVREGEGVAVGHRDEVRLPLLLAAELRVAREEGEGRGEGEVLCVAECVRVRVPEAEGEGVREPLRLPELEALPQEVEDSVPLGLSVVCGEVLWLRVPQVVALAEAQGVAEVEKLGEGLEERDCVGEPLALGLRVGLRLALAQREATGQGEGVREAEGEPLGALLRLGVGVLLELRLGLRDCVGLRVRDRLTVPLAQRVVVGEEVVEREGEREVVAQAVAERVPLGLCVPEPQAERRGEGVAVAQELRLAVAHLLGLGVEEEEREVLPQPVGDRDCVEQALVEGLGVLQGEALAERLLVGDREGVLALEGEAVRVPRCGVGESEGDTDTDTLRVTLTVPQGEEDPEGEGVEVSVSEGEGVKLGLGLWLALALALGRGLGEGVPEAQPVALDEGLVLPQRLGEALAEDRPVRLCVTLPLREVEGLRVGLRVALGLRLVVGQCEGLLLSVEAPERVRAAVGERLPVEQCEAVPDVLKDALLLGVREALPLAVPAARLGVAQEVGLLEGVREALLQALRLAAGEGVGSTLIETLMLIVGEVVGEVLGQGEALDDTVPVTQLLGAWVRLPQLEELPVRVAMGESVGAPEGEVAAEAEPLGQCEAVGAAPVGVRLTEIVLQEVLEEEEVRPTVRVREKVCTDVELRVEAKVGVPVTVPPPPRPLEAVTLALAQEEALRLSAALPEALWQPLSVREAVGHWVLPGVPEAQVLAEGERVRRLVDVSSGEALTVRLAESVALLQGLGDSVALGQGEEVGLREGLSVEHAVGVLDMDGETELQPESVGEMDGVRVVETEAEGLGEGCELMLMKGLEETDVLPVPEGQKDTVGEEDWVMLVQALSLADIGGDAEKLPVAQGVGVSEVVGELEEQKDAVSLVLTEAEMDALAVTLEERHSVAVPLLEEERDKVSLADTVPLPHPLAVALMDGLPLNDSVPLCDCEGLPEKVEESVADAHSETVLVVDTHCDTVRVLL
jgi:hypothetical protein